MHMIKIGALLLLGTVLLRTAARLYPTPPPLGRRFFTCINAGNYGDTNPCQDDPDIDTYPQRWIFGMFGNYYRRQMHTFAILCAWLYDLCSCWM